MMKRRLLKIIRKASPQGVSYFAIGTALTALLAATIVGAPFSPLILAGFAILAALLTGGGILAVFAPAIF